MAEDPELTYEQIRKAAEKIVADPRTIANTRGLERLMDLAAVKIVLENYNMQRQEVQILRRGYQYMLKHGHLPDVEEDPT